MRKIALITAGGAGLRMGADKPKQFLELEGKSLLCHAILAFHQAYDNMEFVVVLPADQGFRKDFLLQECVHALPIHFVEGGATRFHSVQSGLRAIGAQLKDPADEAIVFVHDGVRCLVSPSLIQRCAEQAIEKGSAIPVLPATESVRLQTADGHRPFDRNQVMLVQTPQTFHSSILLPAFEQKYHEGFTDEATVLEAAGQPVFLVAGEFNNIKITRPIDLELAAVLLRNRD
jgi:2-C-methyl-D-erythritol 4-phosphate cytidylyltransferase